MITKKFEPSLHRIHYDDDGDVNIIVKVVTDHAEHTANQVFRKGKPVSMWVQAGRAYTPDQRGAVEQMMKYYYPIAIEHCIEWMAAHNFDKDKHRVEIDMDGSFHIYYARYSGDKA